MCFIVSVRKKVLFHGRLAGSVWVWPWCDIWWSYTVGSVCAESDGPGKGSTFTVDLPLAVDRREVATDLKADGGGRFQRPRRSR